MKLVQLTKGLFAKVDDEDFDRVIQYNWHAEKNGKTFYARRNVSKKENGGEVITRRLHTDILNGMRMVDHKDGDGLNCQKYNLRLVTKSQNNFNSNKNKRLNNTCIYKGVSKTRSKINPYRARITKHGKTIFIGYFATEEEAARAYDREAKLLFGEFARLNFPED